MKTIKPLILKLLGSITLLFLMLTSFPDNLQAQLQVNMCEGQTYYAYISVHGYHTFQWQWTKKYKEITWPAWSNISGATKNYYYFTPADHLYDYRLRVIIDGVIPEPNQYIAFDVFDETHPSPPTNITFEHNNYCPGTYASVDLTASGGSGAGYIWSTSSTSLNGTEANPYTVTPAPDVSRTYYVRRKSGNNCLPSNAYSETLNVYTESVQASSISASANDICPGSTTTLTANGGTLGTNASWKWYVGTTYKYTGNPYTTPALDADVTYTVKATGTCNSASSVSGISKDINVNDVPTTPTSIDADDEELPAGGSTILRKNGGSDGSSTTWRWYIGGCGSGDPVDDGEIHNTGTLTETKTYYLRGEDPCGNTGCVSKTVTVIDLSIDTQPENETVCVGSDASVSVAATGSGVEYQWKKDGEDISGATSSTYSITGAALADAGSYTCTITDGFSTETSDAAVVTVLEQPVITSQPAAQVTACYGENVQLEVVAQVTEEATFQWRKNTVDITGETGSTLEFESATPDDGGFYNCYIDDVCGDLTTTGTNLSIGYELPEIDLGDDQVVCRGEGVLLSAASGYTSYLWSDGETTQNITVTDEDGSYSVTGTDNYGCEKNSNTVHLSFAGPYEDAEICIVTVDTATWKNMIVWERTPDVGIASYNVWREGSTVNDSVLVQNVALDAESVVVDEGSEPESKAHRYWITAVDTCGNESGRSKVHKTMLLSTSLGPSSINLNWLEYEVEGQKYLFVGYKIFRSASTSSFSQIDSLSSGSPLYVDDDPPAGTNYYRIMGLMETACNVDGGKKAGTGPYNHSLSNMDDNKLKDPGTGMRENIAGEGLVIYPNPFGSYTMLRFSNPGNAEYTLYVRDLSGKLLRQQKNIKAGEIRLERGSLIPGYYQVELVGDKILRGKLIVQ